MVEIKIFVVTTEKPDNIALEELKVQLCEKFGGLTESATAKGLWLDKDGKICEDDVKIWTIYTDLPNSTSIIDGIAKRIKIITFQHSQMYVINNKPKFV